MSQDLRQLSGILFAPPLHRKPEGPLDASKVKLPPKFTVLVAGASRGIGLGIAKAYARANVSGLVLSSRSLESVEAAAKEVLKINPRVKLLCQACDIINEEQVKELAEATKTAFGRLDVLVINAGASPKTSVKRDDGLMDWPKNFLEQDPAEMEFLWRIHVQAPFLLMHHFLPLLQDTDDGAKAVIQLSSAATHYVPPKILPPSYSLSKLGSTRLVEMCHEGHKNQGIVAFAIQPGGVRTEMGLAVPQSSGFEALLTEDPELAGSVCVWLTKERREWLSGRYIDSRWDFDTLMQKKEDIIEQDLLKFRMRVGS